MSGSFGQGQQAVVLGASVGGLLAARVLSEHFERVVVLERDPLPSEPGPRKGVPHARHTHGLLAGGYQVLADLFPGIKDDLVARGAQEGDLLEKSLWHIAGGAHQQFESGLRGIIQSRSLLEHVIRQRLAAIPNVGIRDQASAERPVIDVHWKRIVGLQITDRRDNTGEFLPADLVVDCTGRGSRLPAWLEALGFPRPAEDRVEIDLAYATQNFRRAPGDFGGLMAVVIPQSAPNKRMGVAVAVENDQWSLTLSGMLGDHPPTDPAGFRDFARGLADRHIYDFLGHAEPLTEIYAHKMPGSQRRRYERLRRFPQGLLALGDALCSFNPVYGQGMTVAALQAAALGRCLAAGPGNLDRRYFREAARLIDTPWQIAVNGDFQFPETRGRKPWLAGITNAWLNQVHRAAHYDREVALAFHRVANLLDPPGKLLSPRFVARVLKNQLRLFAANPRRPTERALNAALTTAIPCPASTTSVG